MHQTEPLFLTEAQVLTLDRLIERFAELPTLLTGERFHEDTLIVKIQDMFIGIEPDGYAHS